MDTSYDYLYYIWLTQIKGIKISVIDDNIFPNILKECDDIPVISGMAKGIDSYSHTACLKANGFTVAILGCGIDICYPKEHVELMKKIIERGTVISEYPPNTPPRPEYFPRRNRIISGLASKILLAEAGEKSGALITAEYAVKQKKELYVAAGNIYCKEFKGSNKLISNGAKIYLNPKQLLGEVSVNTFNKTENIQINSTNSALEEEMIKILKYNNLTIDQIASKLNINIDKIINVLFTMEINNKVKVAGGKYAMNH